jgi:hypothetical protein
MDQCDEVIVKEYREILGDQGKAALGAEKDRQLNWVVRVLDEL